MAREDRKVSPLPPDIPLSLYVHLPWCVHKCPYCDFNSHALKGAVPEREYVDAVLADLAQERDRAAGRALQSIFIGGGTPSLFSGQALARLLEGIRGLLTVADDAEITLEANPGAAEAERFADYRRAGVNRLSIGVQSLDDDALKALGRVHDAAAARLAVARARDAGFEDFNLDLMFALPGQSPEGALADVASVIAMAPTHVSHYQLTLEPGTPFWHRPPALPDDDAAWDMQRGCGRLLREAGYRQYEVSAWARPGRRSRHNLNYWRFGDYLGVGAGAHGKVTGPDGAVWRYEKVRHPGYYLARAATEERLAGSREVAGADRGFEFMLNALRLDRGVPVRVFRQRTGLGEAAIEGPLAEARRRGLMTDEPDRLRPTALGRRFLNDLAGLFLP